MAMAPLGAAPATPADRPDRLSTMRRAGLGLAGAGGLALAWAGYEALSFRSARDDLGAPRQWNQQEQELYERSESARTRALWLAGTGAAVVATGAVLYLLGADDEDEERTVQIAPSAGPGLAGAVVFGRF